MGFGGAPDKRRFCTSVEDFDLADTEQPKQYFAIIESGIKEGYAWPNGNRLSTAVPTGGAHMAKLSSEEVSPWDETGT
jgi:hypothetical protein